MHKLKVINKPLKVDSLPIVSPWYVDDFYINDKVITNSEDIRLKFFLDKSDWTDRNAFCSGLKSIKNMELMLYVFLEDVINSDNNSVLSEYLSSVNNCWKGK